MGWGGFGANGSVHWKIIHTGERKIGGFVRGRDPNVTDTTTRDHAAPSHFTVTLRFKGGPDEARTALEAALKAIHKEDGYAVADVVVSATERHQVPADNEFEVLVKW